MKLRLTKPLPQPEYGRVIPAGVVINAPPALSARLLRQGIGQPVQDGEAPGSAVATPEKENPEKPDTKEGEAECPISTPGPVRRPKKKQP